VSRPATTAIGRPFGAVERLSAPNGVGVPAVAVAPDGGTLIAWDEVERSELPHPVAIAAAWRDPGATSFSAPQTISGSPPPLGALRDVSVAAGAAATASWPGRRTT